MKPSRQMRKRNRRPRGGAVRRQAWEGGLSPAISGVRNWRERGRDIGVAEVHGGAPMEGPLAVEEIDEKGKHGGHRIRIIVQCTNRPAPSSEQLELSLVSHARWYVRSKEWLRNGP